MVSYAKKEKLRIKYLKSLKQYNMCLATRNKFSLKQYMGLATQENHKQNDYGHKIIC